MPEITDDEMDARLTAAGTRWRESTPVPTLPAERGDDVDVMPEPHHPRRVRSWIAAASGAALVAAAVVIGIAVTRGDNGSPLPAGQSELAGTSWLLQQDAPESVGAGITFSDDGKVSGSDGCNSFSGPVTIGTDTLHFGNLARTEMACPVGADVQSLFAGLLVGDVRWSLDRGELVLSKPGAGSATFGMKPSVVTSTDPKKLVGVTWGLSGVEHDSGASASGSGSSDTASITLTFDGKGGYRVDQRCGYTTGDVSLGAGSAVFANPVEHPHSCPAPTVNAEPDFEAAVAQTLSGGTTWSVTDGTLTIAKGSTTLTFTDHPSTDQAPSSDANPPATSLLGTSWVLADINSPTLHQTLDTTKTKLRLTIDAKGVFGIDDGVNFHSPENQQPLGISAEYIFVSGLTSTAAGCAPAGAQNCTRSNVIADFFDGKLGWAVRSGHLTLTKGATTLVYVPA